MARRKCSHPKCKSFAHKGGVCIKHGAKVKKCSDPTCTNIAVKGGVCVKHGAKGMKCSDPTCTNISKQGGVCVKHGAKLKKCSDPMCPNIAQKGGVCRKHGAKKANVKKYQCSDPTCTNNSHTGGVCWSHHAKQTGKKCSESESHSKVKTQGLIADSRPTKNLQLMPHDLMCCQYEDKLTKLVVIVQGSTRLTRILVRVKAEENMDYQVATKGANYNPTELDGMASLQGVNPNMGRNATTRKRGNLWV